MCVEYGSLVSLLTDITTARGLESLSRDRMVAKDQVSRDRRQIIKAYKMQQKQQQQQQQQQQESLQSVVDVENNKNKNEEAIRHLYQQLSHDAVERAINYGTYDAAQARAIVWNNNNTITTEKENTTGQQQHLFFNNNKNQKKNHWMHKKHPLQNMIKGYFKKG